MRGSWHSEHLEGNKEAQFQLAVSHRAMENIPSCMEKRGTQQQLTAGCSSYCVTKSPHFQGIFSWGFVPTPWYRKERWCQPIQRKRQTNSNKFHSLLRTRQSVYTFCIKDISTLSLWVCSWLAHRQLCCVSTQCFYRTAFYLSTSLLGYLRKWR